MKELKRGLEKLERTNIKWLMGQSPVEGMAYIPEDAFIRNHIYLCTNYYPTNGTFYLAWGTRSMLGSRKQAIVVNNILYVDTIYEAFERSGVFE
jgi:hypothetical protein